MTLYNINIVVRSLHISIVTTYNKRTKENNDNTINNKNSTTCWCRSLGDAKWKPVAPGTMAPPGK